MKPIAALALLAFAAAPIRAEDDPKKVLESFQGEWKMVEYIKDGRPDTKEQLKDTKVVIDGPKMAIHNRGNKKVEEMTFTLDPKAVPSGIDIGAGKKGDKEAVVKGIYKLEKDRLVICFGLDAKDRPKEFKSEKGTSTGMFVLERVKK